MNTKQRKTKQSNKNEPDSGFDNQGKYEFNFTDRYVRKKKVQAKTISILVPILLFSSLPIVGLLWDRVRFIGLLWAIYMLALIVLLIKYGMNRIYGNDITIENNKIFYRVSYRGYRGHMGKNIVIRAIKKVEIKKSLIMIHGYILSHAGSRCSYTLRIPKEIENVNEFIRIARSLVGKE